MNEIIFKKVTEILKKMDFSVYFVNDYKFTLPWDRMFEVRVEKANM